MKKYLKLNSLEVYSKGNIVYSEEFHDGLNVLSGDNGTGKSTVIELIAYVLGYEEIELRKAQKQCDYVIGNFSIDRYNFYLKRIINTMKQNDILYKDNLEHHFWITLPYKNSKEKKSFSSHIFELLGYPKAKNDSNSTITMFQILRLIYSDQNTPPDSLLNRQKEYDNKSTRKAISDFLLGFDDFEIYELKENYKKIKKDLELKNLELIHNKTLLDEFKVESEKELEENIKNYSNKIKEQLKIIYDVDNNNNKDDLTKNLNIVLINIKKNLDKYKSQVTKLDLEIKDSKHLISILKNNILEINDSMDFYSVFSGFNFVLCPECLEPIVSDDKLGSNCILCKSTSKNENKVKTFYLDRKLEIEFQINESKKIISKRELELKKTKEEISLLISEKSKLESELEIYNNISNEKIKMVSFASRKIGSYSNSIEQLKSLKEKLKTIEPLNNIISNLNKKLFDIESKISSFANKQINYKREVETRLNEIIIDLLKKDKGYEISFSNPQKVDLVFEDSKVSVDGETKFSASSDSVLKVMSRFAIFLLSLEFKESRIPNFCILDCMEDKGMQSQRAHQVQKAMIEKLSTFDKSSYQLIVATSMPCEEFLSKDYLIGDFIKKGNHTLKIEI